MNVRKLLRYEIWSKSTTLKILVAFGIIFAVSFLGFWCWDEVSRHWLTKSERVAAKVALQQIDALQNSDSLSNGEFKVRRDKAELAVDSAEKVARTRKDELIYTELIVCGMGSDLAQIKVIEQKMIEQDKFKQSAESWEFEQQSSILTGAMARQSCLALHKELD